MHTTHTIYSQLWIFSSECVCTHNCAVQEIWSRFDIYQTGFVDLRDLQLLMCVLQYNIPDLLRTGRVRTSLVCFEVHRPQQHALQVSQEGESVCMDYLSFGSGPDGADLDGAEAESRANYHKLVDRLSKYERSLEVTTRIEEDGVDIQCGENTFIFNASIDNGVIMAEENSKTAKLIKVSSLPLTPFNLLRS